MDAGPAVGILIVGDMDWIVCGRGPVLQRGGTCNGTGGRVRKKGREKGMALLVVLSAIAFLLPMVFSGLEMGRFHLRRVHHALSLQEARRYAESGLSQVMAVLQQDGVSGGAVDHLGEPWAAGMAALKMPSSFENQPEVTPQLTIVVEDSARYLNLNDLVKGDGTVEPVLRGVLERLLGQKGLEVSSLEALIDWLDPDNIPTGLGGAENAWYQTEGRSYGPENGPMQVLENVSMLRGWREAALTLVRPFVRAVSHRCSSSGVNVNTASPDVLKLLDGAFPVASLLEMRLDTPVTNLAALATHGVVIPPSVLPLLRVKSDCFEARIHAQVGAVRGLLQAWLVRKGGKVEILRMVWGG